MGPAPFCGMLLADLGADVILIERAGAAADALTLPRGFDVMHRGKRSVALDLKRPEGVAAALAIVDGAAALIEGFRPGVMERLGLGPDICFARNSRLVYGRVTGWGQDGPLADRAGHDIDFIARTGVLHAIGRRNGPPQIPLNLPGDFGGGALYLAFGLLAAVLHARETGRGQVVDAAVFDGATSMLAPFYALMSAGLWRDRRGVNLIDSGAPFYDVYETSDGRHVAVGAIEPKFYAQLVDGLALDAASLPGQWEIARWGELRDCFAEAFRRRTRDEWADVFDATDACVAPVLSLADAAASPHAQARGTHVFDGERVSVAPAPRFSRTPGTAGGPPPQPGAHTAEILREAGLTEAEIERLLEPSAAAPGSAEVPPR